MKRNIYKIGFILIAVQYIYSVFSHFGIRYIIHSNEVSGIKNIISINYYLITLMSVILSLILITISILEVRSSQNKSISLMSVLNACLAVGYLIITYSIKKYVDLIVTKQVAIPFLNYTMGEYVSVISIVYVGIKFCIHIAIIIIMILCYKSNKKDGTKIKMN